MRQHVRHTQRLIASGLAAVMLATLTAAAVETPAFAQHDEDVFTGPRDDLRVDEPVPVTPVEPKRFDVAGSPPEQVWQPGKAAANVPQPAIITFDLGAETFGATGQGGDDAPVTVQVPSYHRQLIPAGAVGGRASVRILDQEATRAAGVTGLLVAVSGSGTGPVDLSADYSSFARLYGGGWALRLSWKELPACAASTPQLAGCLQASPAESLNRVGQQTVSTRLMLDDFDTQQESVTRPGTSGTRVFALTADGSGDGAGDYTATDLSPAGSWAAGGNDGSFSYSYPLRLPPAAGPMPQVSLGYSSASHDGRTSGSNNQASWVGDGWGYQPGFIERSYKPCSSDDEDGNNDTPTGDLCWDGDGRNMTMSLNGTNTTLVLDDDTGQWHAASDANWRIERLGSAASSTSATSERWKVTTTDGAQYFFAAEVSASRSRLTVPVFGNHTGEPCHAGSFADSSCDQAYRWMLDKVIDVHGNMSRYFYTTEHGHYGAGGDVDNRTAYDRSVDVERIEYGLRADDPNIKATGRIVFTTGDRCLDDCWNGSDPVTDNWPDTPWDLDCNSAPCTSQRSPAFFTSSRLVQVTTQVRNGTTFRDVDSWKLEHEFQDYGDDEQVVMWLSSIQHTGHVGGQDITLPRVEFTGEALPNRVDAAAGVPVMWRWRMFAIKTETGAVITVGYRDVDCTPSSLPSNAHNNAKRCYPVRWTPAFHTEPVEDWFHKHVVDQVIQTDTTGGQVAVQTSYEYSTAGGGTSVLWGFDDSEFTDDQHRTYGQWRGYPQVTTRIGDPAAGTQQRTRARFYRGMNDQPLPGGGTRSVQISDAEGNTVVDHEALVGRTFESLTYNGSAVISGSTTKYWTSNTATRARDHDGGDLHAWMTGVEIENSRTRLVGSTWQRTRTITSVDDHGRPVEVNSLGDIDQPGDEYCTRTEYADNTTAWILNAVSRTEVVSVDCDTTPSRPDDLVSDKLTYFDGASTHGASPSKGLATRVDTLDEWEGGPVYATTRETDHDTLGRTVEHSDALGRTTTTAYTPTGAGPVTKTTTTNPLGHVNVTELEPAWGQPTATVDPNGRRGEVEYDALGRIHKAWRPGLDSDVYRASMQFEYLVRDDAPSAVTTKTLNQVQDYITSVELFDSLLRTRQTQVDTADGGRLLTETIYDTHGRVEEQRGPHYNDQPPDTSLGTVAVGESARRVEYVHDGAGRVTDEIILSRQEERWRTITSYGGSSDGFLVTMQPPEGAPATATITNARGQTTQKRTYQSNTTTGAFDTLTYGYTATGQLESMTDQAGNIWSWDYDLRGRETASHDPDAGTTTMTYDLAGQLTTVTDARGQTLQYQYDQLGRKTARLDGEGTLLAEWQYDTAHGGIGYPGKATRWHDNEAYINETFAVNQIGLVSHEVITLPESLGPLAGQHWFVRNHTVNGLVASVGLGEIGDLPGGGVAFDYDHMGNMNYTAFHGIGYDEKVIVDDATYTPFNELQTRTLGYERPAWHGFVYEEDTRRLERSTFDRQASIHSVADVRYTYDPAGNITSIADIPEGLTANHELQCFEYDTQRRLIEAWAQADTSQCATQPDMSILGGPAPYWNSYEHDNTGNRTADTLRVPGQQQVERDYTYPDQGQPQPHTLQQVDVTGGSSGQMDFTYDTAGNTTTREVDGQTRNLTWDTEGNLTEVSGAGDDSEMIYTADGARLIRDDGDTVTAFLPNTEAVWDRNTDDVDATRYFTHAGHVVAVNTGTDVADWTWMGVDHHGTTTTHSVNAYTAVEHVRRLDPYGNQRGDTPQTWPGQQHFVGGIKDTIELIHIGVRSYDPTTGRFVSKDPILDVADDQQINGYTYANANPVTYSDPTGLLVCAPDGHGFCPDYDISKQPIAKQRGRGSTTPSWCVDAICRGGLGMTPTGGAPPPPPAYEPDSLEQWLTPSGDGNDGDTDDVHRPHDPGEVRDPRYGDFDPEAAHHYCKRFGVPGAYAECRAGLGDPLYADELHDVTPGTVGICLSVGGTFFALGAGVTVCRVMDKHGVGWIAMLEGPIGASKSVGGHGSIELISINRTIGEMNQTCAAGGSLSVGMGPVVSGGGAGTDGVVSARLGLGVGGNLTGISGRGGGVCSVSVYTSHW